jgi:hypothetical protein
MTHDVVQVRLHGGYLPPVSRRTHPHMKRRKFMTLLGGAAGAWPFGASAQQPAKGGLGHAKIDANDPTRTSVRSREQQLSLGFQTIQACPGAR